MTRCALFGLTFAAGTMMASAALAANESVGILAGLGVTAASGKTEMGDGAGSLEGTALTIAPALEVGKRIGMVAGTAAKMQRIVVVSGDTKVDFAPYAQAVARIRRLEAVKLPLGGCAKPEPIKPPKLQYFGLTETDVKTGAVDIAAALIGATKVDTTVKGFDVANPDALLLNSVAAAVGPTATLRSEMGRTDYSGALWTRFDAVARNTEIYEKCVADADKDATPAHKATAAAMRAALDSLATSKDATPSLLESALALEPLIAPNALNPSPPLTLRVNPMNVGGNIITRSNIFLQFGFPGAVTIRGGMVANWRLTEPGKGTIVAWGTQTCITAEKDLAGVGRSKHRARLYCSANGDAFTLAEYNPTLVTGQAIAPTP